ncbi:MAG: LPS export ABC transporter periplasmic protein LptC [Planctomycetota bacterium]|nr:LPS export ABC transporter periplasmic protein LptC [Planctomycetota bacterium]MDI6786814.1 LPS export ABC transporter periplasmic protein LptC [Planctomycetota bacterium]
MIRFHNITISVLILLVLSGIPSGSPALAGREVFAQDERIINNWSYPHYQDNKLVWEMKGKTAVESKDEIIISVLEMVFYPLPVMTDQAELTKSGKIIIKADMASFKKQQQTVSLHEGVILKKVSEPQDENDETMQTKLLNINLADRTFFTDSLITLSRSHTSIKSKGCSGNLNFDSVSFLSSVQAVIYEVGSGSLLLGTIFSGKPGADEELGKISAVITITSEGPCSLQRANPEEMSLPDGVKSTVPPKRDGGKVKPVKSTAQQISLQNKARVSYATAQTSVIMPTTLEADNITLLLDRRESPITKRNTFYLSRIQAQGAVKINDLFHTAICSDLVFDNAKGHIVLQGDEKSSATIHRPFNSTQTSPPPLPNSPTIHKDNGSYISLSAQKMKIQIEKNNILLIGRKEVVFANESVFLYTPPISPSENSSALPKSESVNKNRIQITADNDAIVSFTENQIYLENNIKVSQKVVSTIKPQQTVNFFAELRSDKLFINWNQSRNTLEKLKAQHNVSIVSSESGSAWCEILEWLPLLGELNLKSNRRVKLWHKGSSSDADEIIIRTQPQSDKPFSGGGYLGEWSKIETKNRANGAFKINPPPSDEKDKD